MHGVEIVEQSIVGVMERELMTFGVGFATSCHQMVWS
jgi:hypothetical protein